MNRGFEFSELETRIHMVLDALSNGEGVEIKDEWIDEAGAAFTDALRQHVREGKRKFRLRMSNMGKPLCQLQHEKKGTPAQRYPYNHVVRMMIGHAVESIVTMAIKASGVNVTGGKSGQVALQVNDSVINGEDDIQIEGAVWDVKSSSPYLYQHKWSHGWDHLYHADTFGYVEQLFGYATAQGLPMGGWVVVDKSSGEVKVVPAKPTPEQLVEIEKKIQHTERVLNSDAPLEKLFMEEDEMFRKHPTGNKLVPMTCVFCQFQKADWPNAVLKPQAMSQAKEPKPTWYTVYENHVERKDN